MAVGSTGRRNTLIFWQRWSVDMKQRRRIYYSAAQRSEIWDRWQAGEAMSSIGRRFDRESSSVFSVISPTGGIRPPDRHRAKQALSLSEREEISRWLSMRRSLRSIARHLGRSASTVSREVSRNGGAERYRAAGSDQTAWDRARRPKLCKLACRPFLRRTVSIGLQRQWSPEQIAGWRKGNGGDSPCLYGWQSKTCSDLHQAAIGTFARVADRFGRSGGRAEWDKADVADPDEAEPLAQIGRRHVDAAAVHAGDEVAATGEDHQGRPVLEQGQVALRWVEAERQARLDDDVEPLLELIGNAEIPHRR